MAVSTKHGLFYIRIACKLRCDKSFGIFLNFVEVSFPVHIGYGIDCILVCFCIDLENHVVQTCIVTGKAQENEKRAEGFTDASVLMTPDEPKFEPIAKRRGMPKGGWPKKEISV